MSDFISKALLSGLGLASLTKEALQDMGKDLARRSNMSEQEGRRLIKDLQRKSEQTQKALEKTVEAAVHKVVKTLNLATMDDLHRMTRSMSDKPAKKKTPRKKPAR